MQTVRLNGSISKFGEVWETNCTNIRDIFKLIECQTQGFRQHLLSAAEANVNYEIQRGKDFLEYPEELLLNLNEEDIIITEVPSGSKSGGAKILGAIAIVAIMLTPGVREFFLAQATAAQVAAGTGFTLGGVTYGGLTLAGSLAAGVAVSLLSSGVSQMLAPGPETDDMAANDAFLFNGPTNRAAQGLPVPVAYGELIVGGAPIAVYYQKNPHNLQLTQDDSSSTVDSSNTSTYGTDNTGNAIPSDEDTVVNTAGSDTLTHPTDYDDTEEDEQERTEEQEEDSSTDNFTWDHYDDYPPRYVIL